MWFLKFSLTATATRLSSGRTISDSEKSKKLSLLRGAFVVLCLVFYASISIVVIPERKKTSVRILLSELDNSGIISHRMTYSIAPPAKERA
jgi:hypothetical protein